MRTLLPKESTPIEVALELGTAPEPRVGAGVANIKTFIQSPPSSALPFLVWGKGLEILRPFFASDAELLEWGWHWAKYLRSRVSGVKAGVAVLGYEAQYLDPPERRHWWWKYQLEFDRIRTSEEDLDRIDQIVSLSQSERSKLRRVYHAYNIKAAETGYTRLGSCRLAGDSGVRVRGLKPKWSFGRKHDFALDLTQADYEALGIWIPEVPSELWEDMDIPWETADFAWEASSEIARRRSLGQSLEHAPVWLKFTNSDGEVIGYRNAKCRAVSPALEGFDVSGSFYGRNRDNPSHVLAFGQTDFGEGYGATASHVSLLFDPDLTDATKPGLLWLEPSGLSGGVEIARQPLDLEFGETVRDHIQILMRL